MMHSGLATPADVVLALFGLFVVGTFGLQKYLCYVTRRPMPFGSALLSAVFIVVVGNILGLVFSTLLSILICILVTGPLITKRHATSLYQGFVSVAIFYFSFIGFVIIFRFVTWVQ